MKREGTFFLHFVLNSFSIPSSLLQIPKNIQVIFRYQKVQCCLLSNSKLSSDRCLCLPCQAWGLGSLQRPVPLTGLSVLPTILVASAFWGLEVVAEGPSLRDGYRCDGAEAPSVLRIQGCLFLSWGFSRFFEPLPLGMFNCCSLVWVSPAFAGCSQHPPSLWLVAHLSPLLLRSPTLHPNFGGPLG